MVIALPRIDLPGKNQTAERRGFKMKDKNDVTSGKLVGALSPVNHKGLYQG